ncbi:urease accessory protein UreD [Trujillonella endophytica]|uniref:Urease accessory protein n=1 Tax=Trujillonella endophytica TaxID=673521 RepID=A0A1H8WR43_9ACTN|nr:urease accessory protein UreD [Trujillella endophytica]SEP29973.1 urease accessory protein [Trujillella endophytica]
MITRVEVVARRGPGGRTVLPVVRASGQLAVRRTGPTTIHLVATAFGPLGGDDAEVSLVVEEGASLTVHTVAAAVALPAREGDRPSVQRVRAAVAGALVLAPEPTVVTARAHHRAELTAELAEGATLAATEHVLLGRAGEEPGRWTGTTRVERAGRPLLHTTVALGPGAPGWLPPVAPRAYAATVSVGARLPVATGQDAVRLPLDDGWTATAWGTELHTVVRALAALEGVGEEVA